MRRQARISAGGTLVSRSASALQVWLWLLLFVFQNEFRISWSIQPGYLDFDNLPETNFTCTGKVIGGYYADLETSCQMFHVCTVGQQDEPMDIKFLCLNGTVFDQETRVCERVDEVDCTKSEKFYSLNLELYGSTTPPIIQPEPTKPQVKPTELTYSKSSTTENSDPVVNELPTTPDKVLNQPTDSIDSTEDPIQESKKDESLNSSTYPSSSLPSKQQEIQHIEEYEEDDAIDDENSDYDEDYSHPQTTTTIKTITITSATTKRPSSSTTLQPQITPTHKTHLISTPPPTISSLSPPIHASLTSSAHPSSTIDPSLLSPQEFIYRHRGPGSEAISFQRQSFRPADGVYITHAPPHQYDHFQYESSRTAPRPVVNRPVPFVQRPQPTPFRPTTIDPRDQILRPGQNAQSSEKLESSVKIRPQSHHSHLPAQEPLPFNPFYYDRKRSDEIIPEDESALSARSVAPPTIKSRKPSKPKSPPRVIVTASASVSDSNGKKLNYTVGNVVSAVKPIVAINYDDYKESDLIFDPFFLDVPKLQRRKTRSSNYKKIAAPPTPAQISLSMPSEKNPSTTFSSVPLPLATKKSSTLHNSGIGNTVSNIKPNVEINNNYYSKSDLADPFVLNVPKPHRRKTRSSKYKVFAEPIPTSISLNVISEKNPPTTFSPVTSRATTIKISSTTPKTITTIAWNPQDYVDDNYEPHAYIPPVPPLAVLVTQDEIKYKNHETSSDNDVVKKIYEFMSANVPKDLTKPESSVAHKISSQSVGTEATVAVTSPTPIEAPACITSHSTDCRIRA